MRYNKDSCTRLFDKRYSPILDIKPWRLPSPPKWDGWRGQRTGLTGLLVLALSACAALPTPVQTPPPWDVPEVWSHADGAPATTAPAALADWWRRFDDPLLTQLIDQARLNNTSVQSAQAALRQSRALRDVAGAALWPSLGSSLSAQRNHSDDRSSNSFQAGLDASWELDVFGAKRSVVTAADATVLASAASLGQVEVSIAAEVALDYIALRSGQERLQIAQANLTSQQETLQLTDWRLQAGLVTTLEAEQARAAVEVTAAQLPALLTQMAQSRHALAVLTGQPPAALARVLAAPGPVPEAPARLALAFPAETLRQRSDVRTAEYQLMAAAARVSQGEAARLPSLRLGGSLGLSALTLGALTDGASLAAMVLASLSWPVVDGGASRAQLQGQRAALAQANFAYQGTVLTALTEVENALVALRGDQERLVRLQNAAAAADIATTLASQRYRSGLVDFQTVLETQRTRLGTQDSVASARATVSAEHVVLYKALGGGWTPQSVGIPTVPVSKLLSKPNS